jgi:hypothetical protein
MRSRTITGAVAALLLFTAGCAKKADVEQVPVGSDVQLTRQDGGVVEGTLAAKGEQDVKVNVGKVTKSVPRSEIADVQVVEPDKPAELPPIAKFREYTVPAGTTIAIELGSSVSSATSKVEDPVTAELTEPVVIDGVTVLPVGSTVSGVVEQAQASGKVKGLASLAIVFNTIKASGESYPIEGRFARTAESTKTSDAKKVGIPAAGGAVIGAILGGKKGAAVGAAVGGGAGAGMVLATPGKEIELPRGTTLAISLGQAFDVRVPIK